MDKICRLCHYIGSVDKEHHCAFCIIRVKKAAVKVAKKNNDVDTYCLLGYARYMSDILDIMEGYDWDYDYIKKNHSVYKCLECGIFGKKKLCCSCIQAIFNGDYGSYSKVKPSDRNDIEIIYNTSSDESMSSIIESIVSSGGTFSNSSEEPESEESDSKSSTYCFSSSIEDSFDYEYFDVKRDLELGQIQHQMYLKQKQMNELVSKIPAFEPK